MGASLAAVPRGGIVVSCQALEDEPLHGAGMMAAMAAAAEQGGATAVRANSPADIAAIRKAVRVPIIGLYKREYADSSVYITPTIVEAKAIVDAGADVVAFDATGRIRPDGLGPDDFIRRFKEVCPHTALLADVSTEEEGLRAMELGVDAVSTTLSGYTPYSRQEDEPDIGLVARLAGAGLAPVLAEGRIWTLEQCKACFEAGAYAVVVGTAITRPREITRRFVMRGGGLP